MVNLLTLAVEGINPSGDGAIGGDALTDLVANVGWYALILGVLSAFGGAALIAVGRVGGNAAMSHRGVQSVVGAFICGLVVASAAKWVGFGEMIGSKIDFITG